jgi:hypothetical protein
MKCEKCNNEVSASANFCSNCGAKIERVELNKDYYSPNGLWEVTTEGDCEGRTVSNLGIHEGFIDEIAFKLADQCFYSLQFKKVNVNTLPINKSSKKEVNILLDIWSNTWDMNAKERVNVFAEIFKDRPVNVKKGDYFASVVLVK